MFRDDWRRPPANPRVDLAPNRSGRRASSSSRIWRPSIAHGDGRRGPLGARVRLEVPADDPLSVGSRWRCSRPETAIAITPIRRRGGTWVPSRQRQRSKRYEVPFQFYVQRAAGRGGTGRRDVALTPGPVASCMNCSRPSSRQESAAASPRSMADARALRGSRRSSLAIAPPSGGRPRTREALGSAVGSGIVDRVFAMEAQRYRHSRTVDGIRARRCIHLYR